jgi:hypothetical protein
MHLLVGEKSVTWYDWRELSEPAHEALKNWVSTVNPSKLRSEPFDLLSIPYRQEQLRPLIGQKPVLLDAMKFDGRLYLQYFSVRTYQSRESIDVHNLPPAQRKRFEDYVEVIGLRARSVPCVDSVVFVPGKNRTEIRMDTVAGMHSEESQRDASSILEQVNAVLFKGIRHQPLGLGLVSFMPAVKRLYRNEHAGLVEYLGFVATTANAASNNQGKVHRKAGQDLRKDPFHVGGKGAVNSIDPYAIGISVPAPSKLYPSHRLQLGLNGSVRMITGIHRRGMTSAEFQGCATLGDYDRLSSLLEEHLAAT